MMNVFITGGAGFIGSHLTEHLLKNGSRVDCLDDFNDYYDPAIKWKNIENFRNNPSFRLIEGDIRDLNLLKEIFLKYEYDTIIHFAARAGVRPSLKRPMLYQDVNIRGTMNLLEMTKENKIQKFIFASSSSIYGNTKKVPFCEDDFVDHPISPYAATKRMGEIICYTYHHLYNISITCLRFFTVYGARQRPDMAIHKFTDLIYRGEQVPMFGDGSSKRDYTYISDIIQGVTKAIAECKGYHIYNLGESNVISLKDLIKLIEKHLGERAVIKRLPVQAGDMPITYANIDKARKELGYNPTVGMNEGIARFVDWYKNYSHR